MIQTDALNHECPLTNRKMPETEVILIRHGETEWNVAQRFQGHQDSDLTEKGKFQVETLGVRFQEEELDQLYSSDLLRTRKTAEAVSRGTGRQVELDVRLREKNLGIFEGLNVSEIQKKYSDAYKAFNTGGSRYRIKSGESTLDLLVRGLEFLEEIRKKHEGRKIGIVTHGGFIRVILKNSLGMSQDTPTRFIIPNTSVHRIIWRKEKWVVSSMGDVFHLNGFQKS